MLPLATTTTSKSFTIDVRLINRVFDEKLQNPSNTVYKNMKNELLSALTPHFKEIKGFIGIYLVRFRKGSVIAEILVEFSAPGDKVDADFLRETIINAADSKGNIGHLTFDIFFLERSLRKTTKVPGDVVRGHQQLPTSTIAIVSVAPPMVIVSITLSVGS